MSKLAIQKKFYRIAALIALFISIIGLIWCTAYFQYTSWIFISLIGFNLLLAVSLFFSKRTSYPNIYLSFVTFNICYFFIELLHYLLIAFGVIGVVFHFEAETLGVPIVPYFEQPSTTFDAAAGYRWKEGKNRTVKIANGELIYDNYFQPNTQGYLSREDYTYEKKDSTIKRYLVFGDSFTDAYYLNETWVERCNRQLDPDSSMTKFEFYSFAINGGGISNWHRIFFEDIVPNYEFDGLLFAVFSNDLARPFFLMHHSAEAVHLTWTQEIPKNEADYVQNFIPNMGQQPSILPKPRLDAMIQQVKAYREPRVQLPAPNLYFLTYLHNLVRKGKKNWKDRNDFDQLYGGYVITNGEDFVYDDFKNKYGTQYVKMLEEVIDYCKKKEKDLLFCSIPELYGLQLLNKKQAFTQVQLEMNCLSKEYNVPHFDGYQVFEKEENKEALFLKYDGHWSQKGSDLFGDQFLEFFKETLVD